MQNGLVSGLKTGAKEQLPRGHVALLVGIFHPSPLQITSPSAWPKPTLREEFYSFHSTGRDRYVAYT